MKLLNLYVDKWYIIGAYCSDGVVMPIIPSTGDDRFWLFFYEDRSQEKVVYGLVNKKPYYSGAPLYHGDIFSCITDTKCCFERYGRKIAMSEVFHEAGILTELHDAVAPEGEKVSVRISFSRDISDAARVMFMKEVLEANNFVVDQISARIDFLALHHAQKQHLIREEGHYLVLNACNENLYYSLYEYAGAKFAEKAHEKVDGLGTDPRGRALVEDIVNKINQQHHFLSSEPAKEKEYCNLMQYVEQWLAKLDSVRFERPVSISDVRLSCVPNTYSVLVLKSEIDRRTSTIVEEIVRVIGQFVQKHLLLDQPVKGVLMLGDLFSNDQFVEAFTTRFVLPSEAYVRFPLSDLSKIVSVYEYVDLQQFSLERDMTVNSGSSELAQLKSQQAEAERLADAQKALEEQRKQEAEQKANIEHFKQAMDQAYDFQKQHRYAEMKDAAATALSLMPDDAEAQQLLSEATRMLSEAAVRNEQYNKHISLAQQKSQEKQWQEVLSYCEAALNLKPDSAQAKRLRDEARRQMEITEELLKSIARADLFIEQCNYDGALAELDKALAVDASFADAVQKRQFVVLKIEEVKQQEQDLAQRVEQLKKDFSSAYDHKDYELAVDALQQLVQLQPAGKKWSEQLAKVQKEWEDILSVKQEWSHLKSQFNDALFDDQLADAVGFGDRLMELGNRYSIFQEDLPQIERNLIRVKGKLEKKLVEQEYPALIEQLESLIAKREWENAKKLLRRMQQDYPAKLSEIKGYFKQIFILEG